MALKEILKSFTSVYGGEKAAFISRAGGRVELIGGHTDYNSGFVIAAAVDRSCRVAASPRGDGRICVYSELLDEKDEFELSGDLKPSGEKQWANYARGVAAFLLREGLSLRGANLYISSEVPLGAGLSSSAALEVALCYAIVKNSEACCVIDQLRIARICQKAENVYANSPCGIMDQLASVTGRADHCILLDCRDLRIESLPFASSGCAVMIFNSMVRHEIAGGEYGKRRAECEDACKVLNKRYPHVKAIRDADEAMLGSVREKLGEVLFARAMHVVTENGRVLEAAESLRNGEMAGFGDLMSKSHDSARDLYRISCEETDFLVEHICNCQAAYGARIMGGGFGGSVVALVGPNGVEEIKQRVCHAYRAKFDLECEVFTVKPWQGTEIIELG